MNDERSAQPNTSAWFELSPTAALIVDSRGHVAQINARTRTLLDGDPVTSLFELFRDCHHDALRHLLDTIAHEPGALTELATREGVIVDLTSAPDATTGLAIIQLQEVGLRVRMAAQLQHARRLAAIGHLAAGVAHEINNPLAVMELGLRELSSNVPDAQSKLVNELRSHTDRIARIVANLHTFADAREPQIETLQVREVVRAARKIARNALGDVQVQLDLSERELSVRGDRRQLEQVFVNLLTNAASAMGRRGHVRVEGEACPPHTCLRVIDAGPGIPAEMLDEIFTPFVRAGPGGSTHMGLGLSISWGIVQENGGTMRASNHALGGACFELQLPAPISRERQPPLPTPPDSVFPEIPPTKVLCVEDEAVLRRTLLRLLQVFGHEAVGVASAEEALSLLSRDHFDLVVTDLRLPGMSGEDLCRTIKERFPRLIPRTIVMSGFFREASAEMNFLQKPFSAEQLQRALALAVTRGSAD